MGERAVDTVDAGGDSMKEIGKLEARFDAALATLGERSSGATEELRQRIEELEKSLTSAREEAEAAAASLKKAETDIAELKEAAEQQDKLDEEDIESLNRQIDSLGRARQDAFDEMRKTKQYNRHLRKMNNDLRKANADNVGDASLINASLESEIEQLRDERDADLNEVNSILERLAPLVEGENNG